MAPDDFVAIGNQVERRQVARTAGRHDLAGIGAQRLPRQAGFAEHQATGATDLVERLEQRPVEALQQIGAVEAGGVDQVEADDRGAGRVERAEGGMPRNPQEVDCRAMQHRDLLGVGAERPRLSVTGPFRRP